MPLYVVIVCASVLLPTFLAVAFIFLHRKWQDRDGRRSPIEGKAIYGAGEQLRKRIEDHTDSAQAALLMLFWLGPYFLAVWALSKVEWGHVRWVGEWIFLIAFIALVAWSIRHIVHHGRLRRRANEGLKAELFTAQQLNRLIASGCTVIHDVPGDKFNLDHVVIGPRAVYMVETKSVRKPAKTHPDAHKVSFDGEVLRFPHFASRGPIEQARRQAEWLRTYLRDTLKASINVVPVVALPGWWIDSTGRNPDLVRVFNPAGRGASFMADGAARSIPHEMAGLIAQALVIRYPTDDTKK